MFDERIETGNHITDDMRQPDSGMPFSVEELKDMGIPNREIQAFITEYHENERLKVWEIEEQLHASRLESRTS